jgi:hypothetical protein
VEASDITLIFVFLGILAFILSVVLVHAVLRIASAVERLNKIIDSGVPTFLLKEERCPKCKIENPFGWRFCGKCGKESPLGYNCTDCGQPAMEDQKFCTFCGRKFEGKE